MYKKCLKKGELITKFRFFFFVVTVVEWSPGAGILLKRRMLTAKIGPIAEWKTAAKVIQWAQLDRLVQ